MSVINGPKGTSPPRRSQRQLRADPRWRAPDYAWPAPIPYLNCSMIIRSMERLSRNVEANQRPSGEMVN